MSTTPEKKPAKRSSKIKIDPNNRIVIKGAREHNLKNVDLELPRDKLIVMTGLSGSGKSSLAFDTIYADGQRRYMESLSSYARQFLGQMEKPDVDEITGLSPAISIDQKTTSHNPRSTVGTVTEIYDYLRLMYARIGVPHCPICGREITQQTVDEMVDEVMKLPERTRFQVLAPVVRARKGTQAKELDAARRAGFARVRVDGNMYDLSEEINLEKNIKHTVEIVVDRLVINDTVRGRLADSIETALAQANGLVVIDVIGGEPMMFSQSYACPEHGISVEELTPRMFSFNNPFGACEKCTGLGTFMKVDPARVIPDKRKSIRESAIKASGWYRNHCRRHRHCRCCHPPSLETQYAVKRGRRNCSVYDFYSMPSIMRLATNTPLADAWDSECVTPLPSPMIYSPLCRVSRFSSIETSML